MNHLVAIPSTALVRTRLPPTRFDPISIGLHWATGLLIAGLFASAWSLGLAADGAAAAAILTLHRSLGLGLWLVAICRLGWRLGCAVRPPLPPSLRPVQRLAAAVTEGALYALLLLQPLTGLAQSVTRGRPFHLFVFEAPTLMARNKPLTAFFHEAHEIAAWVLLGLIGLHAAAALFHGLVAKDGVLESMLPWRPAKKTSASGNKSAPRAV